MYHLLAKDLFRNPEQVKEETEDNPLTPVHSGVGTWLTTASYPTLGRYSYICF